ncbi:hypothetical protein RB595_006690 [Gaeumannomyces hyphopodioides]
MPYRPFNDDYQIATAMQRDVVPALDRLAENASLLDRGLRRFDRDEPPPYVSSTEDDDDDYQNLPPPDQIGATLDEPLNDEELRWVYESLEGFYHPGARYDAEAELERDRLESSARAACDGTRKYFVQYGDASAGRAGYARINIMARRNIKRRWEKLGVWNPEWGIPGRAENPQPNDKTYEWKWPWQDCDRAPAWNPHHPVARALELRRGMRRSEHAPVVPWSRLGKDASASQANSFITSRPWFMHDVEAIEETQRSLRLPLNARNLHQFPHVRDRWKERGDWKEEKPWDGWNELVGWKWRHESPSPEPEDHKRLDDPTLDLTPSEVDALEAVRPPTPEPPRVYIPPDLSTPGLFGPRLAPVPPPPFAPPPPVRWARLCQTQQDDADNQPPPPRQTRKRPRQEEEEMKGSPAAARRTGSKRRKQQQEVEQVEQAPPPLRQTRKRSRQEKEEVKEPPAAARRTSKRRKQQQEAEQAPPPRRSARIAAKNGAAAASRKPLGFSRESGARATKKSTKG